MVLRKHLALLLIGLALLAAGLVHAAKISDVRGTKHNLSAATTYVKDGVSQSVPTRNIKATSETEVCIFCHTPHGNQNNNTPALWNRTLSSATYTASNTYTSSSMDADATELAAGPGGSSKLCLSCHDGTMAVDKVNVNIDVTNKVSSNNPTIAMNVATEVKMPAGAGLDSGFTRNLGTNLSNDHPISFTYNSALIANDGELNTPAADNTTGGIVMNRGPGMARPVLPLEGGKVQCSTCHDPHLRDTLDLNAKFLRQNRTQASAPGTSGFQKDVDIICLACHNKGNASWAYSAHAHDGVATPTYQSTTAAALRGFDGKKVWEVSCLNCHDTHTVQGSRRLLREGTTPLVVNGVQTGVVGGSTGINDFSKSAIENTCYQCHDGSGAIINATGNGSGVPNIKADFELTNGYRMPISLAGEDALHDITGKLTGTTFFPETIDCTVEKKCGADFMEKRANLAARHAECTDCHNPHRVIKGQNGLPGTLNATNTSQKAGTHRHENTSGYIHSNAISGVLRGSWGVEPDYQGDPSFQTMPTKYDVKRGDPGTGTYTALAKDASYVTREYQVCLKCHSNYGYDDDNVYPSGLKRPLLGGDGKTAANANGHTNFTRYTNQAKEFQAPANHNVAAGSTSRGYEGGAGKLVLVNNVLTFDASTNNNNHRSWHPVMAPTGRTGRAGAFLSPWNNNQDANNVAGTAGRLGVQTMLCSDCHGSATGTATVMPTGNTNLATTAAENGAPWGPHGSTNPFILKGTWSTASGEGDSNTLCFKCHNAGSYSGGGGTGFNTSKGDGHSVHSDRIDTNMKCNFCHVAVPHGWKNRGLLANLRDVGPEAGLARGTDVGNGPYTNGPYYRRAYLRVTSFPSGTSWSESNCNGGRDSMKSQCENAT